MASATGEEIIRASLKMRPSFYRTPTPTRLWGAYALQPGLASRPPSHLIHQLKCPAARIPSPALDICTSRYVVPGFTQQLLCAGSELAHTSGQTHDPCFLRADPSDVSLRQVSECARWHVQGGHAPKQNLNLAERGAIWASPSGDETNILHSGKVKGPSLPNLRSCDWLSDGQHLTGPRE